MLASNVAGTSAVFLSITSHLTRSFFFILEFSSPLLVPQSIPGSSRALSHPLKVSFPAVHSPCVSDFYNHINTQGKVWGTLHLSLKLEPTKLLLVFVLCCCERSLLRGVELCWRWGLDCSLGLSSPHLFRLWTSVWTQILSTACLLMRQWPGHDEIMERYCWPFQAFIVYLFRCKTWIYYYSIYHLLENLLICKTDQDLILLQFTLTINVLFWLMKQRCLNSLGLSWRTLPLNTLNPDYLMSVCLFSVFQMALPRLALKRRCLLLEKDWPTLLIWRLVVSTLLV